MEAEADEIKPWLDKQKAVGVLDPRALLSGFIPKLADEFSGHIQYAIGRPRFVLENRVLRKT